jgi:hypothetical protein
MICPIFLLVAHTEPLPFLVTIVEHDGARWAWWRTNASPRNVQRACGGAARAAPPPDVPPDQPHPRPRHDPARHLRRLRHPFSTCCLASRWKEYMAFLRSFYVADDI